MLKRFRVNLMRYSKSRWSGPILLWSSVIVAVGSLSFFLYLGFGNHNGGSGTMGTKLLTFLSLIIMLPAVVVFNFVAALLWALGKTIADAMAIARR